MKNIVFYILLFLVSCLKAQTLYLSITDIDNRALRNAVVNINGSNYTADVMGKLNIDIPVGTYDIFVLASSCMPYSGTITINNDITKTIKLDIKWNTITVKVNSSMMCKVKVGDVTTTTSGGQAKIAVREGYLYDIYVEPQIVPFHSKVLAKTDTTIIINMP